MLSLKSKNIDEFFDFDLFNLSKQYLKSLFKFKFLIVFTEIGIQNIFPKMSVWDKHSKKGENISIANSVDFDMKIFSSLYFFFNFS